MFNLELMIISEHGRDVHISHTLLPAIYDLFFSLGNLEQIWHLWAD
jgi:hypothetical protein